MLLSIIEQALIAFPLAMGAYISLSLLKVPDFSIESAFLLGAVAAYLARGFPLPGLIFAAFFGGMSIALTICFFYQYLKAPYLLCAIAVNGLTHGITQYCLGGAMQSFQVALPLSELSFLCVILTGVSGLVFLILRSQSGYSFAIYGNNPHFFESHGISEKKVFGSGLLIAHALAGLSGFLFARSNGFVDLTMNYGIILLCLTTIMFGKLLVRRRRPNLIVPFLGLLCYLFLQQMLLRAGLNLTYFNAFQAMSVLAIYFSARRKRETTVDNLGV